MVVDTSAVIAILTEESGAEPVAHQLVTAESAVMSTASFVELGIVLESRLGAEARSILERFIREMEIELLPLDDDQAQRAVEGWRRFGKGRHAAGLNLGDCYTYGLASTISLPVLCTGEDFSRTDVEVVPRGG